MAAAKRVTLIVWFVGMGVLIGLTVWSGAGLVGHAIISAGWATALVILGPDRGAGCGRARLWLLFPRQWRPSALACVLLRYVCEATKALLPSRRSAAIP